MGNEDGPLRKLREHHYTDPDSGTPQVSYDVMYRSPPGAGGAWGDYYLVARYSDKAAAEHYVRTGNPPRGYG